MIGRSNRLLNCNKEPFYRLNKQHPNLGSRVHLDGTNFYLGLQFVHRGIFVMLSGDLGTREMQIVVYRGMHPVRTGPGDKI